LKCVLEQKNYQLIKSAADPKWQRGLRLAYAAARFARIVGSNHAKGIDVCLFWMLCIVR